CRRLECGLNVSANDPPLGTRSLDIREVEVILGRDVAGHRRRASLAIHWGGRRGLFGGRRGLFGGRRGLFGGRRGLFDWRRGLFGGRRGLFGWWRRLFSRGCRLGSPVAAANARHGLADGDRRSFGRQNLLER